MGAQLHKFKVGDRVLVADKPGRVEEAQQRGQTWWYDVVLDNGKRETLRARELRRVSSKTLCEAMDDELTRVDAIHAPKEATPDHKVGDHIEMRFPDRTIPGVITGLLRRQRGHRGQRGRRVYRVKLEGGAYARLTSDQFVAIRQKPRGTMEQTSSDVSAARQEPTGATNTPAAMPEHVKGRT